jgi:hypothetical protein
MNPNRLTLDEMRDQLHKTIDFVFDTLQFFLGRYDSTVPSSLLLYIIERVHRESTGRYTFAWELMSSLRQFQNNSARLIGLATSDLARVVCDDSFRKMVEDELNIELPLPTYNFDVEENILPVPPRDQVEEDMQTIIESEDQ